jgi:hypothetical protein
MQAMRGGLLFVPGPSSLLVGMGDVREELEPDASTHGNVHQAH